MGKKYELLVSAISGKNGVIRYPSIVDENDLEDGVAEGYVKSKHLKVLSKAKTEKLQKEDETLTEASIEAAKEKQDRIDQDKKDKLKRKEVGRLKELADAAATTAGESKDAADEAEKVSKKSPDDKKLKEAFDEATKKAEDDAKVSDEAADALKKRKDEE